MQNINQNLFIDYADFKILERELGIGLERYGEKANISSKSRKLKESLRSFLINSSKKALFITSVPFYWFIFFKSVVGWFDISFFAFVIVCSVLLSYFKLDWGLLNWGMR